jgi:hypothetical protein
MEKFLENLCEAEELIKKVDHMVYVTYPLIQDKRLVLKIILELKNAIVKCINSILQYEYLYKRIRLFKDPKENLKTFKVKCAPRYQIEIEEIKLIMELFNIIEKHKKSPFEFKKQEKIVILSENSEPKIITIEDAKGFLSLAKKTLIKSKQNMGL